MTSVDKPSAGGLDGLRVFVADPYADADEVAAAGATLVPLAELLPVVDVPGPDFYAVICWAM